MENNRPKRLYTEKEIGALIQRATELQEQPATQTGQGLSLEEIEHIAEELGLAPDLITQAALEMDFDLNQERAFSFLGSPFIIDHAFMLDGEITEKEWEKLLIKLRQLSGNSGEVNRIGKTMEWSRGTEDGGIVVEKTQVQLTNEGEYTSFQIRKYYRGAALFAYILSFVISFAITGIFLDGSGLSDLLGILLAATGGFVGFIAARLGVARWAKNQKKKLKNMAEILRGAVMQSRPSPRTDIKKEGGEIEVPGMKDEGRQDYSPGKKRTKN